MIQLPHKLSELANIALNDVVEVEQRKATHVVNLDDCFIGWTRNGVCTVCAAGAVMVERFNATGSDTTSSFGEHNQIAFFAIDKLRLGYVGWAQDILQRGHMAAAACAASAPAHELDRDLPAYDSRGAAWHEAMQELIDDLEQAGL